MAPTDYLAGVEPASAQESSGRTPDTAHAMSVLARQLDTAPDLAATLAGVTAAALAAVPGAAHAGILRAVRGGRVRTQAASDPIADGLDRFQAKHQDGPTVTAVRDRRTVTVADLEHDARWPAFVLRSRELGVRSVLCEHLYVAERNLGALTLYATGPHAFTRDDDTIARIFAAHAAIALNAADHHERLAHALDSRDVIGQAKGVLMVRDKVTADEAFARLVSTSQHSNRPVIEVARELLSGRTRREHPPRGGPVTARPPPPCGLRIVTYGRPIVIELAGEIDACSAPIVDEKLRRPPVADTIVDLARVTFLSAAGLTLLLRLRKRLQDSGHTLSLTGASSNIRRVITAADLNEDLPCTPAGAQRLAVLTER